MPVPEDEIYAVLATVIAATPEVTARPGLLIRFDATDPTPNRPIRRNDGDTPLHVLEYLGSEDGGFTTDEHYGTYSPLASETWAEVSTHSFRLTILGPPDNERLDPVLTQWRAVRSGLRDLGPKMGLEYVDRWGPLNGTTRVAEKTDPVARGSKRRIYEVTIPVVVNIDGDDLSE